MWGVCEGTHNTSITVCTGWYNIHLSLNCCLHLPADIDGFVHACMLWQPHQYEWSPADHAQTSPSWSLTVGTAFQVYWRCVYAHPQVVLHQLRSINSSIGTGGTPSTTSWMAMWFLLSGSIIPLFYPNLVRGPVSLCTNRMLVPCSSKYL